MTCLDLATLLRGMGVRARCVGGMWRVSTRDGRVMHGATVGDALVGLLGGAS